MDLQVFKAIKALAEQYAAPYPRIHHGAMPQDSGLAMAPATGAQEETFLDLGTLQSMFIVLNGKHTDAEVLYAALSNIHTALTTLKQDSLPKGDTWSVYNISTSNRPVYIDQEKSSGQWLYGSSLRVDFDCKGVN